MSPTTLQRSMDREWSTRTSVRANTPGRGGRLLPLASAENWFNPGSEDVVMVAAYSVAALFARHLAEDRRLLHCWIRETRRA